MSINVRHLQVLNLFLSTCFLIFYFNLFFLLIGIFFYFLFLGLGVNIGLHRGFSHSTLEPESILGRICLFFSVLCCMGKPTDWILVHRFHHQYADTDLDPHSPLIQGTWSVFSNQWSLPKSLPLRQLVNLRKKLKENSTFNLYDKYYWFILFSYCSILFLVGGFTFVVYFWSFPSILALLATSLVNSFCHNSRGETVNNSIVSFLTLGEGFHQTHHLNPKKIYFSNWKAFDLSGLIFKLIRR